MNHNDLNLKKMIFFLFFMAIMVETKQLKIIRKQPILKKFKQQSSKQLTLIKFTKEYEHTKIFSWATISLSRKNCDSQSYFLPFNNI